MNHCNDCISRIDLYLDDELRDEELDIFNDHVSKCLACRKQLEERRHFLQSIRAARPSHAASSQLRSKIAALVSTTDTAAFHAPGPSRRRADDSSSKGRARFWRLMGPIPALAACLLLILGIALLWKVSLTQMHANALVDMAVQAHRQQLAGGGPFGVTTSSPAEMTTWFADKVPFRFRLPAYQNGSEKESRYQLSGGRIATFRENNAAYIAYHMKKQLISLLIVSESTSVASGGEKTNSRGLTFHAHRKGGLEVVTWSVHGLTYALVSSVNLPAGQSCGVCHPSDKDRDLIRGLKTHIKPENDIRRAMFLSSVDIERFAAVRPAPSL
jgi:anti-sigma factor RsiW